MKGLTTYIETHKDRFLNELFSLLKLPSVSADSNYKKDVIATAEFIANSLKEAGCDSVEICETEGYPIVYGEKITDPKLPTVLVYGHYDVQPADPIKLWDSHLNPLSKKQNCTLKVLFLHEALVMTKVKCICMLKHWNL